MNSVNIIGNIGHDLELRHTASDKAVLNFNIAVNNYNGETEWFRIVVWDKLATNTANYCSKGSKVGVSGRLSINKYTDKNSQEIENVEIVALSVDFLSHKEEKLKAQSNNQSNKTDNEPVNTWEDKIKDDDPLESNKDAEEISDDDLPF